jgi:uncharacterized protein HemX
MDTTLVLRFINEAFKQHPGNSKGGYEFAMGTLALVCVLLVVGFGLYYRDQKRERRQARLNAAKQIDTRFDRLEGAINTGLDDIQKETKLAIGDLQGKHASVREELTRLKTILEMKGGK